MRRVVLMVAVLGLLIASTVPASAAPVEKSMYWVAECFVVGPPDRAWTAGQTQHIRGVPGLGQEFVLNEDTGQWVQSGTNTTVVNVNVTPNGVQQWGTFMFRSDIVGNFDGSFQLNLQEGKANGKAHGLGVGTSAGDVAKVNLTPNLPADLPEGPEGCGVIKVEVLDH